MATPWLGQANRPINQSITFIQHPGHNTGFRQVHLSELRGVSSCPHVCVATIAVLDAWCSAYHGMEVSPESLLKNYQKTSVALRWRRSKSSKASCSLGGEALRAVFWVSSTVLGTWILGITLQLPLTSLAHCSLTLSHCFLDKTSCHSGQKLSRIVVVGSPVPGTY